MFQLTEAFMDIDYSVVTSKVVNPIDLNKIGKRIESAAYSCYESFLSDVKWIVHNIKAFWSGKWLTWIQKSRFEDEGITFLCVIR